MTSRISAPALGLLLALAGLIASNPACAAEPMHGMAGSGPHVDEAIAPPPRNNNVPRTIDQYDKNLRAQIPDVMSGPPRTRLPMDGIRREFRKDNRTVHIR
jgi:hypothetical protein